MHNKPEHPQPWSEADPIGVRDTSTAIPPWTHPILSGVWGRWQNQELHDDVLQMISSSHCDYLIMGDMETKAAAALESYKYHIFFKGTDINLVLVFKVWGQDYFGFQFYQTMAPNTIKSFPKQEKWLGSIIIRLSLPLKPQK